jgi:hypothetical protein
MPKSNHFVLHAAVYYEDRERVKRLIAPQSVNEWLRGLINDELEELGEPLLKVGVPGRRVGWRKSRQ